MSKAIDGYLPSASMVSFEKWPLKVEAIDANDGVVMVKCNGKWFAAVGVQALDTDLSSAINRHATVQSLLQVSLNG